MSNVDIAATIVDKRKRLPFVMVERVILRAKSLSNNAKLLYFILVDYSGEAGSCFPGQARLASDLGVQSVDTVQRTLAELRRHELIGWKRRGQNRPNVYYLLELEGNPHLGIPRSSERTPTRSETARTRCPNTAPLRSKQDSVEQDSVRQQHPQPIGRGSEGAAVPAGREAVVAGLIQVGVTPAVARGLARMHPEARIREKLEILGYLQSIGNPLVIKNPPGWVRMAIEQDYYPPAHYLATKDSTRKREEARRRVTDAAQQELRERAAELRINPGERAAHWLAAWERTLQAIGRPQLTAQQRTERLTAMTRRFADERDDFFTQHPQLRPVAEAPVVKDDRA